MMRVPFVENHVVGTELAFVEAAIRSGQVDGDGPFTRRVEAQLTARTGSHRVLLTDSVDSALEIALALVGVEREDEVAMPSFNYMPAANACLARSARPTFVDCQPDGPDLDLTHLDSSIGPRTRAIVVAAYAGRVTNLDAVLALAADRGLPVVEDASLGFGATDGGRALGTVAPVGAWCFHAKRHIHGGEAGAVVIQDPALVQAAEELRERGTTRQSLLRGETTRYDWVRAGRAALASDLAAAFLSAQLESADDILTRLRGHVDRYRAAFEDLADAGHLTLPPGDVAARGTRGNGGIFYLLLPTAEARSALVRHLGDQGIVSGGHYGPLHREPLGRQLGRREGRGTGQGDGQDRGGLPNVESLSARLLRLPLFVGLDRTAQDHVIAATRGFFFQAR